MKGSTQKGFTIVELLIVIVVIGVLAAITITSYGNVQMKARNAQTASAVAAYIKALKLYATEKGSYPLTYGTCLGDDYTDYDGDGSKDCWHLNSPSHTNSTFNDRIKPYMNSQLPSPSTKILPYSSYDQVGAILNYSTNTTLDGTPWRWFVAYTMEGNATKCPVGPVASFTSGWPNFSRTAPASGYTGAYGTVGTDCWVPMPDPTSL